MLNLARLKISEKQVERVTERIGQERVEQREKQVQAFLALPMMEKFATPVAHPPDLAVVSMDGGRLQIRGRRSHPKSKCSVYNLRQETPEISQKSPSNEYHTEHFT